jgi:hypothetical protein
MAWKATVDDHTEILLTGGPAAFHLGEKEQHD